MASHAMAGLRVPVRDRGTLRLRRCRRVGRRGAEDDTLEGQTIQRYADLYVRARLGQHLHSEAAHQLADVTLPKWKPEADISSVIATRTNVEAVVAAVALGAGIVCVVLPMVDVARFWWAMWPALGLGLVSFATGGSAYERIMYSGEGGGQVATASRILGCLLAVVSLPVALGMCLATQSAIGCLAGC
jgi:hypothetical protein